MTWRMNRMTALLNSRKRRSWRSRSRHSMCSCFSWGVILLCQTCLLRFHRFRRCHPWEDWMPGRIFGRQSQGGRALQSPWYRQQKPTIHSWCWFQIIWIAIAFAFPKISKETIHTSVSETTTAKSSWAVATTFQAKRENTIDLSIFSNAACVLRF